MLIVHKKQFGIGLLMAISFFVVLAIMFMPVFGGENAFHASDRLFNSISKASTDYFDSVKAQVEEQRGHELSLHVALDEQTRKDVTIMLAKVDVSVETQGDALVVSGGMGKLLTHIIEDSRTMFNNQGEVIEQAYGLPAREALYAWWKFLKAAEKNLKEIKEFKTASVVHEVMGKAVEVGYNYFGIDPKPAKEEAGILTFSLVFYVVYTLWWGFAIFFIAEGFGLAMTKGSKKEV